VTKRKNIDNLLVELQELCKKYDAEISGDARWDISIKLFHGNTMPVEQDNVTLITANSVVKNLD